ncbi:hypothetical protein Hanom_Chr11g01026561 [Helianthus anomalus]
MNQSLTWANLTQNPRTKLEPNQNLSTKSKPKLEPNKNLVNPSLIRDGKYVGPSTAAAAAAPPLTTVRRQKRHFCVLSHSVSPSSAGFSLSSRSSISPLHRHTPLPNGGGRSFNHKKGRCRVVVTGGCWGVLERVV